MKKLKLLIMAVLLGAGLTACEKDDDEFRPQASATDPINPKPTEIGQGFNEVDTEEEADDPLIDERI